MPEYNHQQTIFCLNWLSTSPSNRHGTVDEIEEYARKVITNTLTDPGVPPLIGRWDLVWGPVVFQAPGSTVADNALYVAQNRSAPGEFVIAISGTNPISAYGWLVEDFMINPVIEWPYAANAGKITHGTNVGLGHLLELKSNGQSLQQFLTDQVSQSDEGLSVTVTGHSLGGALSSVTALFLRNTQGEPSGWDPDSKCSVAVLPSAGATPGNKEWRDYFDNTLGDVTDRIWNAIDVVPHAWQISMLEQVPTLYEPQIPKSSFVSVLIKIGIINSTLAGSLVQICPNTTPLPGRVNTDITLTISNILTILETMLANKLIDKLAEDLPADALALIKLLIDDWIKQLNNQPDLKMQINSSHLKEITSVHHDKLNSEHPAILYDFLNFIEFLIQLAYQHVNAYFEMLKTTEFIKIMDAYLVKADQE